MVAYSEKYFNLTEFDWKPMKGGLRNQLLLPISGMMFLIIFGLGLWFGLSYAARNQRQIEERLTQLAQTLQDADFPLSQRVIQQLKGLTGAEFVLCDKQNKLQITTNEQIEFSVPANFTIDRNFKSKDGGPESSSSLPQSSRLASDIITLDDRRFFWVAVRTDNRRKEQAGSIHVLYPMLEISRQRWQVLLPILASCLIAWLVSVALSSALASRLSKPLSNLRKQFKQIAAGDFSPIAIPDSPVEIHDLTISVNEMADRLSQSQQAIRESERMKTLGLLGGGIAHQLRNHATGAILAMDISEQNCQCQLGLESLGVARRQLQLMEKYLQKMLDIGHPRSPAMAQIDLEKLFEEVGILLGPFARHHGIPLTIDGERIKGLTCWGEFDSIQEVLLNLLLNGIQAAASSNAMKRGLDSAEGVSSEKEKPPFVRLIAYGKGADVQIEVFDSGSGVSENMLNRIYLPFATDRPSGVGLGLYVARQIILTHHGSLEYRRENDVTCFSVLLPLKGIVK